MYGSSRLGLMNVNVNVQNPVANTTGITIFERANKVFELTNHLGNVLATVSDRTFQMQSSSDMAIVGYFLADVVTANDYYPGGMDMPGRQYSSTNAYRYGFNGKENDNEVKGDGNQIDYGERIYDPRLGRFLSVDPLAMKFPMLTPYQYASDNPILFIDIDGLEGGKPASLTFNLFEIKNEWDNGPRVSAKINATVQLKVLDNTKIKTQQTLDYKSYLLSHEFTYNANGFDYQYMAYDQNGKPSPKTSSGAIQSQTLIGGSVDIKVVTTEIKSLDEIGPIDYVIILNDKVKGSSGEHLIGNTIGKVVLIGMDLLETDNDKRRKTTLHEIFHTFGPGDRGQHGVSDGTDNLMNANGEGVTLDATQASDVISKMVENIGAKKANDKRFNVDSKKRATDAVKDFTE